jgi:GT2 family glycosyltransferase
MGNRIDICIIILNWNGYKNTKRCLESLLKVKNMSYKVQVIDNGSNNNEYNNLKKDFGNKIDLIKSEVNLGFTGGVNLGIKTSIEKYNPDYFLLLNNDTVVKDNFLSELYNTAKTDSKIGIVSPIIYDIHNKNKILYSGGRINWLLARPIHETSNITEKREASFVTGCCFLINKDLFKKNGYLDNRFFAYFEDTAYCLLAIKNGFKCVVEPRAIIYHNESSSLGKKSSTFTYLFSRNRILFINNYTSSLYKFYFFIYNFIKLIAVQIYFTFSNQPQRRNAYMKGFIDGNKGIGGKPQL